MNFPPQLCFVHAAEKLRGDDPVEDKALARKVLNLKREIAPKDVTARATMTTYLFTSKLIEARTAPLRSPPKGVARSPRF